MFHAPAMPAEDRTHTQQTAWGDDTVCLYHMHIDDQHDTAHADTSSPFVTMAQRRLTYCVVSNWIRYPKTSWIEPPARVIFP